MSNGRKIFLISLGCAKNLADSEYMLGLLRAGGIDPAPRIEEADIALINTCAFVQAAVEETIDTILDAVEFKGRGGLKKIIVTGCFVQRYGYKLKRELPEVDGWLGTGEIHRIGDLLEDVIDGQPTPFFISRPTFLADYPGPRVQATPFYTAYLKIAEGCSHRCSFCIIPSLRGPFRSRSIDSLVIEAEKMAARGVKEINLVAQDTTAYGMDLAGDMGLEDLLERLSALKGIRWIRLMYCHPDGITDRLLDIMDAEESICPYLDIPLQHVNRDILKYMGRSYGKEDTEDLIRRIRSRKRRISLRTTLMVGFPGETEQMFDELYDFVKMARFDHLGVFVYSREAGTAAARLALGVGREEAEERKDKIMSLQAGISEEVNKQMLNQTVPVLIEGLSPETDLLLEGRTATMAPEVDGRVLINKGDAAEGEIVPVLIKEAYPYDLVGEIVRSH
jgi:ribosomal protein S12 methylthiotransferase